MGPLGWRVGLTCVAMWPFRRDVGKYGERQALRFLKRRGWRIVARNYICPLGELDLIVDNGEVLAFVEVKTRTHDRDADPEENVDRAKRRQIERVATYWLRAHQLPERAYRFDVVTVVLNGRPTPHIRHIEEAFLPARSIG